MPKKTTKAKKRKLEKSTPPTPTPQVAAPVGRPRKEIDPQQVMTLRSYGHTIQECADFFQVHRDTLSDNYSSELMEGRITFLNNLRKTQYREALKGNARLLVHLGKSNLEEQKPTIRHEHSGRDGKPIVVTDDPAEVQRALTLLLEERKLIDQAGA